MLDNPASISLITLLSVRWQLREEDVNLHTLNSTLYKARWRMAVDDPSSVPDLTQQLQQLQQHQPQQLHHQQLQQLHQNIQQHQTQQALFLTPGSIVEASALLSPKLEKVNVFLLFL